MKAETDFPNYYTAAVLVHQHQPLHKYYDWTWFARQINRAGNGTQLGAYTPQTPLRCFPSWTRRISTPIGKTDLAGMQPAVSGSDDLVVDSNHGVSL